MFLDTPANKHASQQAETSTERQQHVAALRRVYHMALAVPMLQLDQLWRSYEEFELQTDKQAVRLRFFNSLIVYVACGV